MDVAYTCGKDKRLPFLGNRLPTKGNRLPNPIFDLNVNVPV